MTTAVQDTPGTSARRPGRPRRPDIEKRVMDTVVELVDTEQPVTVSAVVQRSGVSRAALYRRWESLAALVAAALDRGRVPLEVPTGASARELMSITARDDRDVLSGYPESRLRQRVRLGLADPDLQSEIWRSHVARRRVPVTAAYRRAIEAGELREDTDLEALQDLIAGLYYYQLVVRGDSLTEPATAERLRAGLDIAWRGIQAAQPG